jgi:hypothetical protein
MHASQSNAKNKHFVEILSELTVGVDIIFMSEVDQVTDQILVVIAQQILEVFFSHFWTSTRSEEIGKIYGGIASTNQLQVKHPNLIVPPWR